MSHHKLSQLRKLKSIRISYLEVEPTKLIPLEVSLLARFNPPLNGPLPKEAKRQLQKLLTGQQTVTIPLHDLTRFLGELAALLEPHPPEDNIITLEHRPSQGLVLVARCRDTKMCVKVVAVIFKSIPSGFAWEVWGGDQLWDSMDHDEMARHRSHRPL